MFIKTSEKVNRRYKHMITAFQKQFMFNSKCWYWYFEIDLLNGLKIVDVDLNCDIFVFLIFQQHTIFWKYELCVFYSCTISMISSICVWPHGLIDRFKCKKLFFLKNNHYLLTHRLHHFLAYEWHFIRHINLSDTTH